MLIGLTLKLILLIIALYTASKLISSYFIDLYNGNFHYRYLFVKKIEITLFRFLKIENENQDWVNYLKSACYITLNTSLILAFVIYYDNQSDSGKPMPLSLLFNIVSSFITATDWQNYNSDYRLGIPANLMLTMTNFIVSATGISLAVAVVRGISKNSNSHDDKNFGNFYHDFFRSILFVLLPLCFIFGSILAMLEVPQNFVESLSFKDLANKPNALFFGPIAAFEAIKIIGTNGGGYFLANSAHPFENPNIYTNYLHIFGMALLPCALIFYYAQCINRVKHGEVLFFFIWIVITISTLLLGIYEIPQTLTDNLQGKELRFPIEDSVLHASISTVTSGAASADYSKFSNEGVLIILVKLLSGNTLMGGLGSGLLTLIMCVILSLFFTGMMAGRTPEFIGKKLGINEIRAVSFYLVLSQSIILLFTAYSVYEFASPLESDHSKQLIKYFFLYISTSINNGSGFGKFAADDTWINLSSAIVMFIGRFSLIITMMYIANQLSTKKPKTLGVDEIDIHTPFFIFIIIFVMLNNFLVFIPNFIFGPILNILMG